MKNYFSNILCYNKIENKNTERERNPMNHRKFHFTLVELLITIAIIAVLAALLLPALNAARAKAQTIRCVGNIRQVGTFLLVYTEQNNDLIPLCNGNQDGYYQGKWIDCAYAVYRNTSPRDHIWLEKTGERYVAKEPFQCPASPVREIRSIDDLRYIVARHFGMNSKLSGVRLTRVATPSQRSLLFDMDQPGIAGWVNPESNKVDRMVNLDEGGRWRHSNGTGANVLFADGHVTGMRESAIRAARNFW